MHVEDEGLNTCCRCGPARHSRLLAARGLSGFAVDSSAVMLEHARGSAHQDGVSVEFVGGDIRQGCLPVGAGLPLHLLTADVRCSHSSRHGTRSYCEAVVTVFLMPTWTCGAGRHSSGSRVHALWDAEPPAQQR